MTDKQVYEAYLIISKLKKEKKELEFKVKTLEKWYTCPNCAFNNREFEYLKSLKKY